MKKLPNNGVIYEGPSVLNGEPIVALVNGLTRPSENRGMGPMLQVYILPAGEPPNQAVKSGADAAVCGDCTLRPLNAGVCYVITWQGPARVYKSWIAGNLEPNPWALMSPAIPVRLGAWGDPAALPDEVLERFLPFKTTGYTHQWKRYPDRMALKRTCMASVETLQEALSARELGYRYFRTRRVEESSMAEEVDCPKAYGKAQCYSCRLCSGSESAGKSISIEVHGSAAKISNYVKLRGREGVPGN